MWALSGLHVSLGGGCQESLLQARREVARDPGGVVTGSGAWGRGRGQGERSRPCVPTLSGLCPQRSRCPRSAPSRPLWGPLHRRQPSQSHSPPSSAQPPQPPRPHCPAQAGLCPAGRMRPRVTAGTASPKTTCATGKRTAPMAAMKRTAVRFCKEAWLLGPKGRRERS